MSSGSFSLYPMMYFELQPVYKCREKLESVSFAQIDARDWDKCEPEEFCKEDSNLEYEIDYREELSIHNWIEEYGMQCAPKTKFGMIGSLYFIGIVISSFILPPLSDTLGRRPIVLLGVGLQAVASLILIFSKSLNLTYGLIFVMGVAMPARAFVGYVFTMEFFPKASTPIATSVLMGIDGLVLLWTSLFFMYVDRNWKSLYGIVIFMTFVTFIAGQFSIESPRFLISKGRYDDARKVITKMAIKNKLTQFNTRDDEPLANSEGHLEYQCKFEEEVQ